MSLFVTVITSEFLLLAGLFGPIRYGRWLYIKGEYGKAIPIFRGYHAASRILTRWRGPVSGFLAASYAGQGEYVQALPYAEEAVSECIRYKYAEHLLMAQAQLCMILVQLGDMDRAAQLADRLVQAKISEQHQTALKLVLANAYCHLDRLDEALQMAEAVLASKQVSIEDQIIGLTMLSSIKYLQCHAEEALDAAERAAKLKSSTTEIRFHVLRCNLLSLIELNRMTEAQEIATQISQMLNRLNPSWQGAAFRVLAEFALKQGELDRARDYAERSASTTANPNAQANNLLI